MAIKFQDIDVSDQRGDPGFQVHRSLSAAADPAAHEEPESVTLDEQAERPIWFLRHNDSLAARQQTVGQETGDPSLRIQMNHLPSRHFPPSGARSVKIGFERRPLASSTAIQNLPRSEGSNGLIEISDAFRSEVRGDHMIQEIGAQFEKQGGPKRFVQSNVPAGVNEEGFSTFPADQGAVAVSHIQENQFERRGRGGAQEKEAHRQESEPSQAAHSRRTIDKRLFPVNLKFWTRSQPSLFLEP